MPKRELVGVLGAHVGAIACSNHQTAVQHKFHIGRATGLGSSSGDMLADVRGWADDLGLADVVVLQVDDLEQVTYVFVIIDDLADAVYKVDDGLGHPVAWRRLAAEDGHARRQLLALVGVHGLDGQVPVDDTKDIELLPLVFAGIQVSKWFGVRTAAQTEFF